MMKNRKKAQKLLNDFLCDSEWVYKPELQENFDSIVNLIEIGLNHKIEETTEEETSIMNFKIDWFN